MPASANKKRALRVANRANTFVASPADLNVNVASSASAPKAPAQVPATAPQLRGRKRNSSSETENAAKGVGPTPAPRIVRQKKSKASAKPVKGYVYEVIPGSEPRLSSRTPTALTAEPINLVPSLLPTPTPPHIDIAQRLGGKADIISRLGGKQHGGTHNPFLSSSAVFPSLSATSFIPTSSERLKLIYANMETKSEATPESSCPLPSTSPRGTLDSAISSLNLLADWARTFPAATYPVDMTPLSALTTPSTDQQMYYTALLSETTANFVLDSAAKLFSQVWGVPLQGHLMSLLPIQSCLSTLGYVAITKNLPIDLRLFHPGAKNLFIKDLHVPISSLPPYSHCLALFLKENPITISSFPILKLCFNNYTRAANLIYVDGNRNPFRALEFRHMEDLINLVESVFPQSLPNFVTFFHAILADACTPVRIIGTNISVIPRLSEESTSHAELWTRHMCCPIIPPTGPSRAKWVADMLSSITPTNMPVVPLFPAPPPPIQQKPPKPQSKKFLTLNHNDAFGLLHEGKAICLKWNSHSCSFPSCRRAHICISCFKDSRSVQLHRAWDSHPELRREPIVAPAVNQPAPF